MTEMDDATCPRSDGELIVDAMIAPKLSFATHQHGVPALQGHAGIVTGAPVHGRPSP